MIRNTPLNVSAQDSLNVAFAVASHTAPSHNRVPEVGTRSSNPDARPVRVALFGEFGIGNMGNDESARAMIALIRAVAPDSELSAISPDPYQTSLSIGIPALPIRSSSQSDSHHFIGKLRNKIRDLGNLVTIVSRFDAVIVPGTGLLERVAGRFPGGDLTWTLLLSVACFLRRVPLAWFAVGGSRALPAMQRWAASIASRAPHYRSFRDHATAASLRGRTRGERIVPDIAFSSSPGARSSPHRTDVVGLAVINYDPEDSQAQQKYFAAMTEAALGILASGRRVRFLLGDLADADPTESVRGLAASLSDCAIEPASSFGPFSDMVATVAECDVVIASRYHMIVASALAATPIVAVSHADKDDALMGQLGLGGSLLRADTVTSEDILEHVSQCYTARSEMRSQLIERTDAFRSDVLREFDRSGIVSTQGMVLK